MLRFNLMKTQLSTSHLNQSTARPGILLFNSGSFSVVALAVFSLLTAPAFGAVPKDFVPDMTFAGSALTGWHVLGQATWKAKDGEITGTPTQTNGGWLVLDKGYQDLQMTVSYQAGEQARAGVLLRAEKTPEGGLQGILVAFGGDAGSYNIVLDAEGREISRTNMLGPPAASFARIANGWMTKEKGPRFAAEAPLPTPGPRGAAGAVGAVAAAEGVVPPRALTVGARRKSSWIATFSKCPPEADAAAAGAARPAIT